MSKGGWIAESGPTKTGNFNFIFCLFLATPTNVLWGINKDGQLVRRFTKYIVKTTNDQETSETRRTPREHSIGSEDGDWEFV